jgi:hypothetical protein
VFGFLSRRRRREEELMRLLVRIARTLERIELEIYSARENGFAHGPEDAEHQFSPEKTSEKISISEPSYDNDFCNDGEPIINFLKSKGFGVLDYRSEFEDSHLYDRFALRIGGSYPIFHDFMESVKRSHYTGKNEVVNVKDLIPQEKSIVIGTSKEMYDNAILDYSYYKKNTGLLRVHLNTENEKGVKFMLGEWLERYVLLTCLSCLYKETTTVPYSFATNIHVETPSRQSAELDVMFKIGDEIYWIEAKTGDYQHYISKYSNIRKELQLKKHNTILVIAGITKSIAKNLSESFSLTVIPVEDLEDEIRKVMIYQEKTQRKALGISN